MSINVSEVNRGLREGNSFRFSGDFCVLFSAPRFNEQLFGGGDGANSSQLEPNLTEAAAHQVFYQRG